MPDPKKPTVPSPYTAPTTGKAAQPTSRMAKAVAPLQIPYVYKPTPAPEKAKPPKKPVIVSGKTPIDDQFKGTMQFSEAFGTDAGRSWSDSFEPEASKQYFARMVIDQFRVDPLLQGFETRWEIPTGWTFVDGLGSILHDEAISNPLYITRVVLSPAAVAKAGFRCVITAKYKP